MQDVAISSQTSSRNFVLIAGLLLYCGAFAILLRNPSFEPVAAVVVLWSSELCCRSLRGLLLAVRFRSQFLFGRGCPNFIVLIAYVIAVSLYLIGGPQWIDQHLPADGQTLSRSSSPLRSAKKLFVFVVFPLRFFVSVSAIGFAISGFSDRACVHSVEVTCPSSSRWAQRSSLFNISSVAGAPRFARGNFTSFNCWPVCRFASCGSC